MSIESSLGGKKDASAERIKHSEFEKLFDGVVQSQGDHIPELNYDLPYPKIDFLRFIVAQRPVVLHGSSQSDIHILEPRQANDAAKVSGNKNAVYAVTDPALAMFRAIQNREKLHGKIISSTEHNSETNETAHTFKVPKGSLAGSPWNAGTIYLIDKRQLTAESNDDGTPSGEWTSEQTIRPIAKMRVEPSDFPYLDQVRELD